MHNIMRKDLELIQLKTIKQSLSIINQIERVSFCRSDFAIVESYAHAFQGVWFGSEPHFLWFHISHLQIKYEILGW